jgi:hypothetical protein
MLDIRDMLYSIDPNTMLLGLLFIIFFVFIQYALSRAMRDKNTSTIIAFCIALLAVYGINRTNFDISGIFYGIGLNEEIIYTIIPWIILGLAFLGSFSKNKETGKRRFRLCRLIMIIGALIVLLSFFAYEKTVLMIIGIILFVIGLIFCLKKKGTGRNNDLIREAIRFRAWAKGQKNPKFAGSWANFIHWMGSSEYELCRRYGVSQNEFVRIFKRYGMV